MSTTTAVALPMDGNSAGWNDQEKALVEAAGLVRIVDKRSGAKELADRPTVEAFLAHCRRTGLDPFARQIYAIYRGGKWGIQVSIDGARLVAERSGSYEGQTAPQWSDDGATWTDAWTGQPVEDPENAGEHHPRFARVGIFKRGFREPLYVVARWETYAVYDDKWDYVDGRRQKIEGERSLSSMWRKMPDLMLSKVAEMLALRKAFPQDLSGLYSTEEMDQSAPRAIEAAPSAVIPTPEAAARDWLGEASAATDIEVVRGLYRDAQRDGLLGLLLPVEGSEEEQTLETLLWARAKELDNVTETVVDVEPEAEKPRDWVAEAKGKKNVAQLKALYQEALAGGADQKTLDALVDITAEKDTAAQKPEPGGDWAAGGGKPDEWSEDAAADAEIVVEPEAEAGK